MWLLRVYQNGLRSNLRASNFLGEYAPKPPLLLHAYAYTLDTPSENPGYGPVCVLVITQKVKSRRLGVNLPLVIRFQ